MYNLTHLCTNFVLVFGGGGAYDDVDEEMFVSEANIFVSEASKLSAGARIFRGPEGPEILVVYITCFTFFFILLDYLEPMLTLIV